MFLELLTVMSLLCSTVEILKSENRKKQRDKIVVRKSGYYKCSCP